MKNALAALVVIAVMLGVSVGAQAGPPADTEIAFVDVEIIPLLLGNVDEAPAEAADQVLVWDWEAQLCYTRSGYAPQPPPAGVVLFALPEDHLFAKRLVRPTERLADGRRYRGDWPRGRLIRA